MRTVSSFPQLSQAEFTEACSHLLARFEQHKHLQDEWLSVDILEQFGTEYMRITTALPIPRSHSPSPCLPSIDTAENDSKEIGIEEHDEEALDFEAPKSRTVVNYDVVLSPTYQVPVLYMAIRDPQHRFPPTMSTLYNHLVPVRYKTQAESAGVIGGITVIDHPVSNSPVFFLHPCQTAEVLEASVGQSQVRLDEYLLLWIGALGKSVGLNVPVALARRGL